MAVSENLAGQRFVSWLERPHDGEPLPAWRLMVYALPVMPIAAVSFPITMFLPMFYAEEMGVGMWALGMVFMATRIWDGVTDPLLGVISDRFPTRFGRRRHWMLIAVPILLVSVVLVFMPRYIVGDQASPFYLFASLVLLYVGYTLAELSHLSWGAELSPDYHERSRVQGWRQLVNAAGMFTVLAVPFSIEMFGDATQNGQKVEAMGWYVIILLPLLTMFAVSTVGERRVPDSPRISVRDAVVTIIKNQYLLRVVAVDVLVATPSGVLSALTLFFITYIVRDPGVTTSIFLVLYVGHIIAVPLWVRISRLIGKHKAVSFGVIGFAVTQSFFLFVGEGDALGFAAITLSNGIIYGGSQFLLRSIMADVTDHDQVQSGMQRTGLFYSLLAMTGKVGPALAVGITFPLLAMFGFDPAVGEPTPEAIKALHYTFVFMPVSMLLIAAAIMYTFPLDESVQVELRRTLEKRQKQISVDAGD